jgi:hypothetical protein
MHMTLPGRDAAGPRRAGIERCLGLPPGKFTTAAPRVGGSGPAKLADRKVSLTMFA